MIRTLHALPSAQIPMTGWEGWQILRHLPILNARCKSVENALLQMVRRLSLPNWFQLELHMQASLLRFLHR